jgi:hypothetical protein
MWQRTTSKQSRLRTVCLLRKNARNRRSTEEDHQKRRDRRADNKTPESECLNAGSWSPEE